MPGFFGTNNPTPWSNWANPLPQTLGGGGGGKGFGGVGGLVGGGGGAGALKSAPPLPDGTQPAAPSTPAPSGGGFGAQGGAAPAAPAAPQEPAATQGGVDTSPGAYIRWTADNGTAMSYDEWVRWTNAGQQPSQPTGDPTGGGFFGGSAPDAGGGQSNPLNNALSALFSGRFGGANPLFGGTDADGNSMFSFLPARAKGAEGIEQFIANFLAQQAQEQRPRSDERENIFRMLAASGQGTAGYGASQDAASMAQGRIAPDALAGYEAQLRSRAASDAGQGYQSSMQRLRDSGQFGRGAAGVDPTLAASNAANSQLGRANLDISGIMEQLTQNRLGQAGALGRNASDVYGQLFTTPQNNLAQVLGTQKYSGDQPLLNLLQDLAMTTIQGDVASRSQPNDFERFATVAAAGSPMSSVGNLGMNGGSAAGYGQGAAAAGYADTAAVGQGVVDYYIP